MGEERENALEKMREKRKTSEAVFIKFTEARPLFKTHAFCFYEGEDAKYYNSRIAKYWHENVISHAVGNKKEVLKLLRRIRNNASYSDVCTMFFIDRDFDESLINTDNDLFETPCYSIENLYAQESVFKRVLQSEFGLNPTDSDYIKCVEDYRLRQKEFNDLIVKFNAVVKYQHLYAPQIVCQFSSIKTSHLIHVQIEGVSKTARHDERITSLISKLEANTDKLALIEKQLRQEQSPEVNFRGKNQLDFLILFIKELKNLNLSGGYFSEKLNCVHLNITENRLSELSQYAITPHELEEFLEKHCPQ